MPSNGGLAQLARAFDWQSKGQEFDSPILHIAVKELQAICDSFLFGYNFSDCDVITWLRENSI